MTKEMRCDDERSTTVEDEWWKRWKAGGCGLWQWVVGKWMTSIPLSRWRPEETGKSDEESFDELSLSNKKEPRERAVGGRSFPNIPVTLCDASFDTEGAKS